MLSATPRHAASRLLEALAFLALAALVTGLPMAAHLAGPVAGSVTAAALGALVAHSAPAAIPATLVGAYLFQNLFVALITPWIADAAQFNTVRGTNFVLTAAVWATLAAHAVAGWGGLPAQIRRFLAWSSAGLGLIAFYFALGLLSDPTSAIIYLRNVATPLILLQIGLVCASRSPPGLLRSLLPLGVAVVAYGYAELFARAPLFDLVGAEAYMAFRLQPEVDAGTYLKELRETGKVMRGFEDVMTVDLFNTPLLAELKLQVYRLMGPNFHPISFSYALCFFGLLFAATGHPLLAAATVLPLLASGSKGALAAFAFTLAATWTARRVSGLVAMAGFVAAVTATIAAAIVVGLAHGDYHVIGLLGGLKGFLQNPFGHGLGVGGNLSFNMATIDWSRSQALGETDRAVESAVGVLLYQMGVAGAALCALYVGLGLAAWRLSDAGRRAVPATIAFAILSITANGILHEEALFAPLAMGLVLALAGLVLGEPRPGPARSSGRRLARPPSRPAPASGTAAGHRLPGLAGAARVS